MEEMIVVEIKTIELRTQNLNGKFNKVVSNQI